MCSVILVMVVTMLDGTQLVDVHGYRNLKQAKIFGKKFEEIGKRSVNMGVVDIEVKAIQKIPKQIPCPKGLPEAEAI